MSTQKPRPAPRREDSLSRERIIDAAIELLDAAGEPGLTFRALSERLATGPGALYWHVANKEALLLAACDAVVAGALQGLADGLAPADTLRELAGRLFDTLDAHPWVGSALIQAAGQGPTVHLLEALGQPVQALGVPPAAQWAAASTLMHYILGVGGQNASNRVSAQARELDRGDFLGDVAQAWAALDERQYPFTRAMAPMLHTHDDRADFLAGIDLILAGLQVWAAAAASGTGKRRVR